MAGREFFPRRYSAEARGGFHPSSVMRACVAAGSTGQTCRTLCHAWWCSRCPRSANTFTTDSGRGATDEVLARRFSETRRPHPLAPEGPPATGIAIERALLAPLRERADLFLDTGHLSPHELRAEIERWYAPPAKRPVSAGDGAAPDHAAREAT